LAYATGQLQSADIFIWLSPGEVTIPDLRKDFLHHPAVISSLKNAISDHLPQTQAALLLVLHLRRFSMCGNSIREPRQPSVTG
jgi:hypothetical protein